VATAEEGFASAAVGYLVDWVSGTEATLGKNLTYLGFHNESPWQVDWWGLASGLVGSSVVVWCGGMAMCNCRLLNRRRVASQPCRRYGGWARDGADARTTRIIT
jgi:hypothetical protein